MHWRVLASPWTMPMPNFASAPSSAISSVTIWPVLRKATDSGPCLRWIVLEALDERRRRVSQSHGLELASRVVAQQRRGRAIGRASGVSASQPFGHAMPRFTG